MVRPHTIIAGTRQIRLINASDIHRSTVDPEQTRFAPGGRFRPEHYPTTAAWLRAWREWMEREL